MAAHLNLSSHAAAAAPLSVQCSTQPTRACTTAHCCWLLLVLVVWRSSSSTRRVKAFGRMAQRVLETDFPLMVPPNPPMSMAHRILPPEGRGGRNGSLRAAYSCDEELLPKFRDGERRVSRGVGVSEVEVGMGRRGEGNWGREDGRELERVLLPSNSSSGCSSDTNTSSSMRSSQLQGQPAPAYRPPRHRWKSAFVGANI